MRFFGNAGCFGCYFKWVRYARLAKNIIGLMGMKFGLENPIHVQLEYVQFTKEALWNYRLY